MEVLSDSSSVFFSFSRFFFFKSFCAAISLAFLQNEVVGSLFHFINPKKKKI
jgi:hypothetical protein